MRGWEEITPSANHFSCSSQILQYVSLEKRNARNKTKTHRKKHPTVLISMDTIKAKAFKEGCTYLIGSDSEPSEANGKSPRNFKGFGIKAFVALTLKVGKVRKCQHQTQPCIAPSSLLSQLSLV